MALGVTDARGSATGWRRPLGPDRGSSRVPHFPVSSSLFSSDPKQAMNLLSLIH